MELNSSEINFRRIRSTKSSFVQTDNLVDNLIEPATPSHDAQVVGLYLASNLVYLTVLFWLQSERITPLRYSTFVSSFILLVLLHSSGLISFNFVFYRVQPTSASFHGSLSLLAANVSNSLASGARTSTSGIQTFYVSVLYLPKHQVPNLGVVNLLRNVTEDRTDCSEKFRVIFAFTAKSEIIHTHTKFLSTLHRSI